MSPRPYPQMKSRRATQCSPPPEGVHPSRISRPPTAPTPVAAIIEGLMRVLPGKTSASLLQQQKIFTLRKRARLIHGRPKPDVGVVTRHGHAIAAGKDSGGLVRRSIVNHHNFERDRIIGQERPESTTRQLRTVRATTIAETVGSPTRAKRRRASDARKPCKAAVAIASAEPLSRAGEGASRGYRLSKSLNCWESAGTESMLHGFNQIPTTLARSTSRRSAASKTTRSGRARPARLTGSNHGENAISCNTSSGWRRYRSEA